MSNKFFKIRKMSERDLIGLVACYVVAVILLIEHVCGLEAAFPCLSRGYLFLDLSTQVYCATVSVCTLLLRLRKRDKGVVDSLSKLRAIAALTCMAIIYGAAAVSILAGYVLALFFIIAALTTISLAAVDQFAMLAIGLGLVALSEYICRVVRAQAVRGAICGSHIKY